MKASPFESEAPLGSRRAIIRRNPDNVQEIEMIEAAWGVHLGEDGAKPFKFLRSEGKQFRTHRCLVPASEFQVKNGDRRFRVTLEDGNFFYLAGMWQPPVGDQPTSFAIVTIEANPDVFFYQERQGAVLLRRQNMAWLDLSVPQDELLVALPPRSFAIEEIPPRQPELRQAELAF
ncbi:SOS response-associated peptidase family protein [Sphingomonas sp.]|uniref:SOS response-associated peptidase family protein n=1 Tax=Sphingomonas sp. TaxID=28214 RepID=UPI002ED952F2